MGTKNLNIKQVLVQYQLLKSFKQRNKTPMYYSSAIKASSVHLGQIKCTVNVKMFGVF